MRETVIGSRPIVLRRAAFEEIVRLREAVLIVGTDRDSPEFPGDHDETTRHFGAFDGQRAVGCLSFMLNEWDGRPAWQLRGMATEPDARGTGIGKALLQFAEEMLLRDSEVRQMWCNARVAAVGFYLKQGWEVASEEFTIKGVGPHHKMTKRLAAEEQHPSN